MTDDSFVTYKYDPAFIDAIKEFHAKLPNLGGYDREHFLEYTFVEFHPESGQPYMAWFHDHEKNEVFFYEAHGEYWQKKFDVSMMAFLANAEHMGRQCRGRRPLPKRQGWGLFTDVMCRGYHAQATH